MDPSPSQPQAKPSRGLLLPVILGLIGLAVLLAARPAYRSITRWRALSLTSQAAELIQQQSFPEAVARLESALRIDPSCPEALRRLGGIYSRFELPAALPLLRALASGPEHTDDDLQSYIEVALKLQRFDLVEGELSSLLARTNVNTRTRIIATEFFYRLGDLNRALAFANEIRRSEPTNTFHHLRAARILLNSPTPSRKTEAIALLRAIPNLTPLHRVDVYDMLATAQGLTRNQIGEILTSIPESTTPSSLEYFLRATLRVLLEPKNLPKVATEAFDLHRNGPAESQTDLCMWLLRHGEHERILAGYTSEEASRSPALFTNYLEALAKSGRWADLQKSVTASNSLDPWILETFRAITADRLKQDQLATEHWRRGFEAAAGNPNHLRALGDLALRHEAFDAAIRAFTLLSENKLHRGTGFSRLATVHERRRDTEGIRAVMRSWAAGSDHPLPEQSFCYLSALLGKDVEIALPRARELFKRMPNRLPYRATVAFLELRRGDVKAAAALFDRAAVNPATATPQSRLVEALVAEANGDLKQAESIASTLTANLHLPEEQALLKRLLKR